MGVENAVWELKVKPTLVRENLIPSSPLEKNLVVFMTYWSFRSSLISSSELLIGMLWIMPFGSVSEIERIQF